MIEQENQNITLGYRIIKIQSTKFSFVEIDENILEEIFSSGQVAINVNLSVHVDPLKSTMTIDVATTLFNSNDKKTLVEHTGRTVFFIQGLELTLNESRDGYDLPNELLIQIHGIAYTHSRALLASDLSSTCYRDKYFLPVINPEELLKNRN